jgi:Asp-tRNA(Asn)/Glu-tRNA(Gln) amidotransferase A subunit family amidase
MASKQISRRDLVKASVAALPLVAGAAKAATPVVSAVPNLGNDAELVELGVGEVTERIRKGELRAETYVGALLRRLERHKNLNSVVTIDPGRVVSEAAAVDKARARGDKLGPLAGLPMVVKDHTDVAGYPTTAGRPRAALNGYIPKRSAPVVQKLIDSGVIVFAKANYAGGATSTNRYFGPVRNPYDLRRISGGSSGGSAAAVAARIVPASLAEDTGGSIRLPAALSGIAGLRPSTYSLQNYLDGKNNPREWRKRYSSEGVVPPTSTVTLTLGPMARTLRDVAIVDEVITGERAPVLKPAEIRLGIPREDYWESAPHEPRVRKVFDAAIARLKDAGVSTVTVDLKGLMALDAGASVWDGQLGVALARSESGQEFDRWLAENAPGATRQQFGSYGVPGVPRPAPVSLTAEEKLKAVKRALQEYDAAFTAHRIHALAFPGCLMTAPLVNENGDTPGQQISVNGSWVEEVHALAYNTFWGPRVGAPGVSIPAGLADGMPVGLCLQGRAGEDLRVLAQGIALETILGRLPAPTFTASAI